MKRTIFSIATSGVILLILTNVAFADYKLKQVMTISGQRIETTVLVKGSRERRESGGIMGIGADVATIEQCDMKRKIEINDQKKIYYVEPFATLVEDKDGNSAIAPVSDEKITRGGVITLTYSITDTGERKDMFGLTARHIKTVVVMEASPDACAKFNARIETDGWYVDLLQFSCPFQVPQNPMRRAERANNGGCKDRFVMKHSGSGKLGFPITETRTISGMGGSNMSFTQTTETLEFSRATLDSGLFDIPPDYSEAASSQDLYGRPDIAAILKNVGRSERNDSAAAGNQSAAISAGAKPAGVTRIGVLALTDSSSESVSTDGLRSSLIGHLTSGKCRRSCGKFSRRCQIKIVRLCSGG